MTYAGLTTDFAVAAFSSTAQTAAVPVVWASAANVLGYGAPSVACAAQTVMIWAFTTV